MGLFDVEYVAADGPTNPEDLDALDRRILEVCEKLEESDVNQDAPLGEFTDSLIGTIIDVVE